MTDPRVDARIKEAAPFARPILTYLRQVIHDACPDVVETIKWGMPHFERKGVIAGLGSFKAHCAFILWRGEGKNQFHHLTSLDELPPRKTLIAYVKQAAAERDAATVTGAQKKTARTAAKPVVVPAYFKKALKMHPKAQAAFDSFPPSHRREYVDWIVDAKTEPTRQRRLTQAIAWIAEGKSRNWKYQR